MADIKDVLVPDLGEDSVEVIEICVAVGDSVEAEDALVTVESDKASMDIPAPFAGKVSELSVKVGDKISEGDLLAKLEAAGAADSAPAAEEKPAEAPKAEAPKEEAPQPAAAPAASGGTSVIEVTVPDIGDAADVDVIEILVAEGDTVEAEDGLITLETDKATMDVPSPQAGKVVSLKVKEGDKVSEGSLVLTLEVGGGEAAAPAQESAPAAAAPTAESAPAAEEAPAEEAAEEEIEVQVPDIGGDTDVDVIEILVAEGDTVEAEDGLITLETDKATMDVPAPKAGTVTKLLIKQGDKASQGTPVIMLKVKGAAKPAAPKAESKPATAAPAPAAQAPQQKARLQATSLRQVKCMRLRLYVVWPVNLVLTSHRLTRPAVKGVF